MDKYSSDQFKKQAPQIIKRQNVDLVVYPDMSLVEDDVLKQIVTREREWWGYMGFGIYSICLDIKCRAAISIDETYGVADNPKEYKPIEELEENGPKLNDCPECGWQTELFCKPSGYLRYLRRYFSNGVFGVILFDKSGRVRGESMASAGNLENTFKSLNIRKGYNFEKWKTGLEKIVGDKDNLNQLLSWDKICLTPDSRGGTYFIDMAKAMLTLHPELDNTPIVFDTRFDSRAYPLLSAIGFEKLDIDKYGGISLACKKKGDLSDKLSIPVREFINLHGNNIKQIRNWQKGLKKENVSKRMKFPGVVI